MAFGLLDDVSGLQPEGASLGVLCTRHLKVLCAKMTLGDIQVANVGKQTAVLHAILPQRPTGFLPGVDGSPQAVPVINHLQTLTA